LLAPPRVDPIAAQQIRLDRSGEALGVELALEAALALPTIAVAVPHIPTDLAGLGDPLLDVSHRRAPTERRRGEASAAPPERDNCGRRVERLDAARRNPALDLDRIEPHEPPDLQVRHAALLDQPADEARRHAEARRQAIDVEQRVRHLFGAAMA